MMWLGKIEIYLLSPIDEIMSCQPFEDIQRQAIDAMLIQELFDLSNPRSSMLSEIEGIIKFFVGEQDNVTLQNFDYLKKQFSLTMQRNYWIVLKCIEFQDTLKNQSFAYQLILSQISNYADPTCTGQYSAGISIFIIWSKVCY